MMNSSAKSQLNALERDRLSVYVARTGPPGWYFPSLGIGTGLMLASYELGNPVVTILAVLLYAAVVGAMVRLAYDEAGILPRLRGMPALLLRPLLVYSAIVLVVVFGGAMGALFLDVPWGYVELGIAACLVLWGGGILALRVYDVRAQRLADRMGIER